MLTYSFLIEFKNGDWLVEPSLGLTEEQAVENYLALCGMKSWIVSITDRKTKKKLWEAAV
jgi:hypothetical protein